MWSKKINLLLLSFLVFYFQGCKSEIKSIDEDLSGYVRPIISRINPAGLIYNRMGFVLRAFSDYFENDNYVLYLNDRKFSSTSPNYWRYELNWEIPASYLEEIINAAGSNDITLKVRITPIQTDISDRFADYPEYISDVMNLEIKRNNTDFTSPVNLFDLWEKSIDPVLRIDSLENLYLAWREELNGVFQAFFSFSEDGGESWSQVFNISRSSRNVTQVDLAIDESGYFYMVWSEEENGYSEVYFSRSLDKGNSWWNPRKLSIEGVNSNNPDIDIDSRGKIFLSWTNYLYESFPNYNKIWLGTSADRGAIWFNRLMADNGAINGEPALKIGENGNVYLICGAVNYGIYCFYSVNYGNNWQLSQSALEGDFWLGENSSLCTGPGDKLYLTWNTQNTTGHNYINWIHFTRGTDKGFNWSEKQYMDDICNTIGTQVAMTVKGSQTNFLLHSGNSLFLLRSSDEGETWTYPEFIPGTSSSYGTVTFDMVTDSYGGIYLVYIRIEDIGKETGNIYFIRTQ